MNNQLETEFYFFHNQSKVRDLSKIARLTTKQFKKIMDLRHDWETSEILALYDESFIDLLFKAQKIHRKQFNANEVQLSTLLNIKTGACPEDCAYCSQSVHNKTDLEREKLLSLEVVVDAAKRAKEKGASRFCMGAAWRNPTDKNLAKVIKMVKAVKNLGMETCLTAGMLNEKQTTELKEAGLDYYNHNIDTSKEYYPKIIQTRNFDERLQTLSYVQKANLSVCSGGILGMGESREDRANMLKTLANLKKHPKSIPINMLVKVEGTPLENVEDLDEFEFIKTIAISRIMMPCSYVRLSAGREKMSESTQALCFLAGANSIFYGDELLTVENQNILTDIDLFEKLGLKPEKGDIQDIKSAYQKQLNKIQALQVQN